MRMIQGDPMRDAARAEPAMRLLREVAGELPSLRAFGSHLGVARGARDLREVERRVRAVLAGLVQAGRLRAMVSPPGDRAPAWLVLLPDGRVLRSRGALPHWADCCRRGAR
jgi:hypothetical protein